MWMHFCSEWAQVKAGEHQAGLHGKQDERSPHQQPEPGCSRQIESLRPASRVF